MPIMALGQLPIRNVALYNVTVSKRKLKDKRSAFVRVAYLNDM